MMSVYFPYDEAENTIDYKKECLIQNYNNITTEIRNISIEVESIKNSFKYKNGSEYDRKECEQKIISYTEELNELIDMLYESIF